MCYTKVVTKEKGNCSVTDKRYNIYKEDIKMAVVKLTTDNFEQEVLQAQQPVLVDFYADWCGPCKMVAPVLEELAAEYDGQIYVYKVNTEQEQELAALFNIRSIPSFLFIPMNDKPQMAMGAMPKSSFKEAIDGVLLKK